MTVNENTTNRGYQLPHPTNNLDYDVARLRASFNAIDADVASLLTSMAGKAAAAHAHVIADVTGLQSALDAKMAANASILFDFLSDVNVASAVANQFLRRSGTEWIPVTLDGSMIETGTVPVARLPAHLATPSLNAAYAALVHSHAIADVTGLQAALDAKASMSFSFSFRNKLINGNFATNQRQVTGTVTLAAGAYGHDRWKAGSGGCTYTFAASGADTVITITSGSLLQIIEGLNIEGGVYALSNAGTAQGRVAINGASTSGSYATASTSTPLLTSSATGGQTVTVEFTTGTLSRVQLEPGTATTAFERRHIGHEIALCQRYYETGVFNWQGAVSAASGYVWDVNFKASKRGISTMAFSGGSVSNFGSSTATNISSEKFSISANSIAAQANSFNILTWTANAEL